MRYNTDTLGRRKFSPRTTKPAQNFKPRRRDVEWMQFLNLHGPLSSEYLFQLTYDKAKNRDNFNKQILRLFDGQMIYKPIQQRATDPDTRNGHFHVYDLTEKGNATQNSGPFYDAFKDPTFNKIRIRASDVPNVAERKEIVPGLITHEWVEEMAVKYGIDNDIYRVRVDAEFPHNAADTLISLDSIENAVNADRELHGQEDDVSGLDVARFGDDDSALVRRQGNHAKVEWVINGNNTMALAGKSALYLRQNQRTKLFIDITGGLGAGVYDRLKEQPDVSSRVFGVNVAGQPRDSGTYLNIRVESWANVRDWLRDAVLDKHEGWYQLANPKYKITSVGKLQLEGKEDMKKRGVKSPDVADALALTLSKPTEGDNLGLIWL